MKDVILYFPDSTCMADFILDHNVSTVQVTTKNTLTGMLSDSLIVSACTKYKAVLENIILHLSR